MSETFEQWLARELSFFQWEFLADHFQGPRPIRPNETATRLALSNKRLIKVDSYSKSTCTILTERGHGVMCAAMGLMADVLTRSNYDAEAKQIRKPEIRKYGYGPAKENRNAARPAT